VTIIEISRYSNSERRNSVLRSMEIQPLCTQLISVGLFLHPHKLTSSPPHPLQPSTTCSQPIETNPQPTTHTELATPQKSSLSNSYPNKHISRLLPAIEARDISTTHPNDPPDSAAISLKANPSKLNIPTNHIGPLREATDSYSRGRAWLAGWLVGWLAGWLDRWSFKEGMLWVKG